MCMQTATADQNYLKVSERRSLWNEHSLGKKKTGKEKAFIKSNRLVASLASAKHFDWWMGGYVFNQNDSWPSTSQRWDQTWEQTQLNLDTNHFLQRLGWLET